MFIQKSRAFRLSTERSRSFLNGVLPLQSHVANVNRLGSHVKRDAQAEIQSKHNDLIKRGLLPGKGHLLDRRQFVDKANGTGIVEGDAPTVSPAVVLDEDGHDISINSIVNLVLMK